MNNNKTNRRIHSKAKIKTKLKTKNILKIHY